MEINWREADNFICFSSIVLYTLYAFSIGVAFYAPKDLHLLIIFQIFFIYTHEWSVLNRLDTFQNIVTNC